jgi:hypothetical protein
MTTPQAEPAQPPGLSAEDRAMLVYRHHETIVLRKVLQDHAVARSLDELQKLRGVLPASVFQ